MIQIRRCRSLNVGATAHRLLAMLEMTTPRPVTSVRLLCDAAAEYGLERKRCISGTGIDEAQLQTASAQVTVGQEVTVIKNIVELLPDRQGLGVEIGQRYHVNVFGIWGFAILTSPTPRVAIETAIEYAKLSFLIAEMRLDQVAGAEAITFEADALDPSIRGFVFERHLAATLNFIRELNSEFAASRYTVHITESDGEYGNLLSDLLGMSVVCRSAENALVLPDDSLDRPLERSDPATLEFCLSQCRALLEKQSGPLPMWSQRVRHILVNELGIDKSVDNVAAELAISERTLRRRLAGEGTSFRLLHNETRLAIARELLEKTGLTVQAAAWRVEYSDPAAFVRAFSKRFGATPGSVRNTSIRAT